MSAPPPPPPPKINPIVIDAHDFGKSEGAMMALLHKEARDREEREKAKNAKPASSPPMPPLGIKKTPTGSHPGPSCVPLDPKNDPTIQFARAEAGAMAAMAADARARQAHKDAEKNAQEDAVKK